MDHLFNTKNTWAKHNQTQKEKASQRRMFYEKNRRPECAVNRKAAARLERRVVDYLRLMADNRHESKVQLRIDAGGYHRPGSMQGVQ